jgi:hypothetical protein
MIPTTPHFYRWLRALPFTLALFASAVSAYAQAPVITSECELVVVLGQSFSYEIQADNDPLGYSVTNLPYWIKCEGNRLSGTAIKLGHYTLKIYALNSGGVSDPRTLEIIVKNKIPKQARSTETGEHR